MLLFAVCGSFYSMNLKMSLVLGPSAMLLPKRSSRAYRHMRWVLWVLQMTLKRLLGDDNEHLGT